MDTSLHEHSTSMLGLECCEDSRKWKSTSRNPAENFLRTHLSALGRVRGVHETCHFPAHLIHCQRYKSPPFPPPRQPFHISFLIVSSVFLLSAENSFLFSLSFLVRDTANMRVTALLALGCYAAIARADVADDAEDAASSVSSAATEASSSATSVVESVTSSAVSKPSFTVSGAPVG